MNDPKDHPIDIQEQRAWLMEHKRDTGLSWKQLGGRVGVAHQTLGLFGGNKYEGDNIRVAAAIFRYRQTLLQQAALKGETPEIPTYFETETSRDLIYRLAWAQRGRLTVAALAPGLGKTMTADHYVACNANAFKVTATPSTATLTCMMNAVLAAIGRPSGVTYFRTHSLSKIISDHFRNLGNALLIVDEAQHLTERAIEEIRSWHDATGVGLAFLGNAGLLQTMEGGNRAIARAQLFSRISMRLERIVPLTADVEAMLEAWRIRDERVCAYVHVIAQKPGALRGATFALELAHMLATSAGEELQLGHVQDAWSQLSRRAPAA